MARITKQEKQIIDQGGSLEDIKSRIDSKPLIKPRPDLELRDLEYCDCNNDNDCDVGEICNLDEDCPVPPEEIDFPLTGVCVLDPNYVEPEDYTYQPYVTNDFLFQVPVDGPIIVTNDLGEYEFELDSTASNPVKIYSLLTAGHNECRCGLFHDIYTNDATSIAENFIEDTIDALPLNTLKKTAQGGILLGALQYGAQGKSNLLLSSMGWFNQIQAFQALDLETIANDAEWKNHYEYLLEFIDNYVITDKSSPDSPSGALPIAPEYSDNYTGGLWQISDWHPSNDLSSCNRGDNIIEDCNPLDWQSLFDYLNDITFFGDNTRVVELEGTVEFYTEEGHAIKGKIPWYQYDAETGEPIETQNINPDAEGYSGQPSLGLIEPEDHAQLNFRFQNEGTWDYTDFIIDDLLEIETGNWLTDYLYDYFNIAGYIDDGIHYLVSAGTYIHGNNIPTQEFGDYWFGDDNCGPSGNFVCYAPPVYESACGNHDNGEWPASGACGEMWNWDPIGWDCTCHCPDLITTSNSLGSTYWYSITCNAHCDEWCLENADPASMEGDLQDTNCGYQPGSGDEINCDDLQTGPSCVAAAQPGPGCGGCSVIPQAAWYQTSQGSIEDGTHNCFTSGCTKEAAINYNPEANIDDGSCELTSDEDLMYHSALQQFKTFDLIIKNNTNETFNHYLQQTSMDFAVGVGNDSLVGLDTGATGGVMHDFGYSPIPFPVGRERDPYDFNLHKNTFANFNNLGEEGGVMNALTPRYVGKGQCFWGGVDNAIRWIENNNPDIEITKYNIPQKGLEGCELSFYSSPLLGTFPTNDYTLYYLAPQCSDDIGNISLDRGQQAMDDRDFYPGLFTQLSNVYCHIPAQDTSGVCSETNSDGTIDSYSVNNEGECSGTFTPTGTFNGEVIFMSDNGNPGNRDKASDWQFEKCLNMDVYDNTGKLEYDPTECNAQNGVCLPSPNIFCFHDTTEEKLIKYKEIKDVQLHYHPIFWDFENKVPAPIRNAQNTKDAFKYAVHYLYNVIRTSGPHITEISLFNEHLVGFASGHGGWKRRFTKQKMIEANLESTIGGLLNPIPLPEVIQSIQIPQNKSWIPTIFKIAVDICDALGYQDIKIGFNDFLIINGFNVVTDFPSPNPTYRENHQFLGGVVNMLEELKPGSGGDLELDSYYYYNRIHIAIESHVFSNNSIDNLSGFGLQDAGFEMRNNIMFDRFGAYIWRLLEKIAVASERRVTISFSEVEIISDNFCNSAYIENSGWREICENTTAGYCTNPESSLNAEGCFDLREEECESQGMTIGYCEENPNVFETIIGGCQQFGEDECGAGNSCIYYSPQQCVYVPGETIDYGLGDFTSWRNESGCYLRDYYLYIGPLIDNNLDNDAESLPIFIDYVNGSCPADYQPLEQDINKQVVKSLFYEALYYQAISHPQCTGVMSWITSGPGGDITLRGTGIFADTVNIGGGEEAGTNELLDAFGLQVHDDSVVPYISEITKETIPELQDYTLKGDIRVTLKDFIEQYLKDTNYDEAELNERQLNNYNLDLSPNQTIQINSIPFGKYGIFLNGLQSYNIDVPIKAHVSFNPDVEWYGEFKHHSINQTPMLSECENINGRTVCFVDINNLPDYSEIYLLGDINQDEFVNIQDILMIVNHILSEESGCIGGTGDICTQINEYPDPEYYCTHPDVAAEGCEWIPFAGTSLNEIQQLLADVNQDGQINVTDIIQIINQIFGNQPVQQSMIMNEVKRLLQPVTN